MNQELKNAFEFRHACKNFLPEKKISESNFNTILEAAHSSPSSFGFEPWKFLVVQSPEMREKLKAVSWGAQNQLPNSSHFVIILAKKGAHLRPDAEYIRHMMEDVKKLPTDIIEMYKVFFTQFQKQDFKLQTDADRYNWAKRQTYIALGNMMHTAALLAIDSCPIEGFHEEKVNEILAAEKIIDSEEYGISVMVGFGYRTEEPRHQKSRQKLSQIVEII